MLTSVKVNAELLSKAQITRGYKSKKEAAEEALKLLITLYQQSEIKELRGKLNWVGDLNIMREN